MAYQIKAYETLVQDMVAWMVSHTPGLTDMSPGSVIRSYCEAAGLCLEELYVSVYLGFRRYLDQIQETIFNFERKGGVKATTQVRFARTVSAATIKTIDAGSQVKTTSGLVFITTAVATIAANTLTSNLVECEAFDVGVIYNIQSAAINTIVKTIDGVDTVTNPNAATGGVDKETDYQYKKRFQDYIEGLGKSNNAGLLYGALTVDGITSSSLQELFPPVANVNVRLYVDDGSPSGVSVAKVAEVQGVIDGDGTEQNPGYRAAGVNVIVYAPSVITQNVDMTISIVDSVDVDQIKIDINTKITSYINNLGVGASIIKNELIAAVMEVYGVYDVTISTPAANVTINSSQVGRLGTITVAVV